MKLRFLSCAGFVVSLIGNAHAVDINVNFDENITQNGKPVTLNSRAFSVDATEYDGGDPDPTDFQWLASLGLDAVRIDLAVLNGAFVTGAGGAEGRPGDPYVEAIESAGAQPVIRLHTPDESDGTGTVVNTAGDAQTMVGHYTTDYASVGLTSPVLYYVIGNEGNADDHTGTYFNLFVQGMRNEAAGTRIYIGGPAIASFQESTLTQYYSNTKGTGGGPDFLDFHQYGKGAGDPTPLQTELNGGGSGGDVQQYGTVSYEAEIDKVRSDIGYVIPVEVGEWGYDWQASDTWPDPQVVTWYASVVGHIVKAGGVSMTYGDKNSNLGIVTGSDEPASAYYGLLMFTGGQHNSKVTNLKFQPLFQHFGTNLVQTSADGDRTSNILGSNVTTNSTVEVYASSNPQNIVVINKSNATLPVTFHLTGASSTVDQWETTGTGLPAKVSANIAINDGTFSASLSPYAVATFVLPSGTSGSSSGSGAGCSKGNRVKDDSGDTWSIKGGVVYESTAKGTYTAGFSKDVIELVYESSTKLVYQENSSRGWWAWKQGTWEAATAPSTSGCKNQ